MDGRRRLAEPVTEGAPARSVAGGAPAPRRFRERGGLSLRRSRLERTLRRWLGPMETWRLPRGLGIAAAVIFVLGSVLFGVVRGGHVPGMLAGLRDVRDGLANAVGFRIASIAFAGQRHLSPADILRIAGITDRSSLLFLDAADVRARLKADPWVADATVLKLYPGRLRIAITERNAFALWQKDGKVAVVSPDGTVVEPSVTLAFAALPLVVGIGAETRAKDFLALLGKYPPIRGQMRAAVLIAERRWNVVLNNGIEIRLPEAGADQALARLVELDRDDKLLTRDITAIDLRLPDRVSVQLSDEAAAARAEAMKARFPKKKGGAA
jgi:cell division protein FtsQ